MYSLESCGHGFATILQAITGYNGPVLIIIGAEGGGVFGAFTSSQWKVSGDFYGDCECFLYRMDPCVNVYRPTGNRGNYIYCNPSSSRSRCDGKPHGIGFGGTTDAPRLFIPESLEDVYCRAGSFDTTFEQGPLLPGDWQLADRFKIKHLEIWGVGEPAVIEAALRARDLKKEINDATVRKAQTIVDKAAFLDDFTSGLMTSKLWDHRSQARGRAAFRVDDEHGGYVLDKQLSG